MGRVGSPVCTCLSRGWPFLLPWLYIETIFPTRDKGRIIVDLDEHRERLKMLNTERLETEPSEPPLLVCSDESMGQLNDFPFVIS